MSTIAFSSVKLYLGAISLVLSVGTLYSVVNSTYLDTSDPLLAHLPHPLQSTDYFANKANPLNTVFIKNAWGWTSGAFALLYATSSARTQSWNRLLQYVVATLAWLAFTSWFFGPPLIERVIVASGGQCVVVVPGSGEIIDVPFEHCYTRSPLSPATHPTLFASLTSDFTPPNPWSARPRLRKGHDVSGHIFLLTMSILFLADQLTHSWRSPTRWSLPHTLAVNANAALIAIWMLATCATALYFHTPLEKFSGFLLGVAAFGLTQLPPLSSPRAVTEPIPCKDD
ncbi:inositol phospholipid synthesis and fat-storage-inducing TM-domain-containing protein [Thelephora terrestris]|uniref:Inositol phospholipid synthesis and fat-storage-inducing TM-domain-containing protein n=1 Tax=Thelephora terrestris TaxID=56493 RepID=A0A9P6HQT8_9AGAM|nr:inositol phospholipid synthesis and fat-storage-inducing TM-domain-containing protein [Thelephora terrestris]